MINGFGHDVGLALIAAAILALAIEPADAAPRRGAGPRVVWITAESLHGHGEISGPVREGPKGRLEVQTPGGTWYECAHSCSDTLRKETVDFWEAKGGGRFGTTGVGVLRFGW